MKFHPAAATLATIAMVTSLQGCMAPAGSRAYTTGPVATNRIPATDPQLDHYIAWVPLDQARTASVAEAMTHISLVNAREKTAKLLCDSDWVMNGEVIDIFGPLPANAPENAGGYPAWYYRISLRPGIQGCQNTDSQKLYHTLQEHLPEWIDVRAARTATLGLIE